MPWIKLDTSTPDKPEIIQISRELGMDPDTVLGKIIKIWCWFDINSIDGYVEGMLDVDIDNMVKCPGFFVAFSGIGWIKNVPELVRKGGGIRRKRGLCLPRFDRHNGETAKKRALKALRQARWRNNDVDGDASTRASTSPSTGASTRASTRGRGREDTYTRVRFTKGKEERKGKVGKGTRTRARETAKNVTVGANLPTNLSFLGLEEAYLRQLEGTYSHLDVRKSVRKLFERCATKGEPAPSPKAIEAWLANERAPVKPVDPRNVDRLPGETDAERLKRKFVH